MYLEVLRGEKIICHFRLKPCARTGISMGVVIPGRA